MILKIYIDGVICWLIDDILLNHNLNLNDGNMKIVEEYAQRKVDEAMKAYKNDLGVSDDEFSAIIDVIDARKRLLNAKEEFLHAKDELSCAKKRLSTIRKKELLKLKRTVVITLNDDGYEIKDIARIADVSLDFVAQTLAK